MNNLDFNIPVVIFITGAVLFLVAPLGLLPMLNTNQVYITALLFESIGVTVALLVFYRDKITAMYIEEI